MGEVILEKEEVLKVYFVCATAVQSQLFSFADFYIIECIQEVAEFDNLAYLRIFGTGEIGYSRLTFDNVNFPYKIAGF